MDAKLRLSIIILNYNGWRDTVECITSLLKSSYSNFQIIIVDNFSPNDSELRIKEYLQGAKENGNEESNSSPRALPYLYYDLNNPDFRRDLLSEDKVIPATDGKKPRVSYPIIFIQTGKNLGFAGGNNVALRFLLESRKEGILSERGKVFLLNPDTVVEDKTLNQLSQENEDFFISGCAIKFYDNKDNLQFLGAYKNLGPFGLLREIKDNSVNEIGYIYGGALLTNLKTIERVGQLPEEYFLYWEETDWCYRAKSLGVKFKILPEAVVYDKVGTSIGRGYLANFYFIRNGLYFYKKYLPYYLFSFLLFALVRASYKFIKGEFRNARAMVDGILKYLKNDKGNQFIS